MEMLGETDWQSKSNRIICSANVLGKTMQSQIQADSVPRDNFANIPDHDYSTAQCDVKMCRICFATDCDMYSMTTFRDLNETYETFTGIMADDEEQLPRYLCSDCADRLMNCARFRRRSLRAHSMLMEVARRHGRVTVELVHSLINIHNPFSDDAIRNTDYRCGLSNKELDGVNILANGQCSTQPENNYGFVVDIKSEVDDDDNNGKDETNYVPIHDIKIENYWDSQQDFNTDSSRIEGSVVAVTAENNTFDRGNQEDSPNLDENIDLHDIIAHNDMINRDDVSVCSFSLEDDTNVNNVDTDKGVNNDKDIVSDEVTSDESMVYPASLFDDIVDNVLMVVYSVVLNEGSSKEAKFSDYTDYHHSFRFVGEDVLNECVTSQEVTVEVKREEEISQDFNEIETEEQQRPEADGSTDDMFRCDICSYQTDIDFQFLDHLKGHVVTKLFHCYECDYTTKRERGLKFHIRTHHGEKPYSCDFCQKSFRHKYQVRKHLENHSGEKSYICNVCNKSFTLKGYQRHFMEHSVDKPYSCHICQKAYKSKKFLERHVPTHSTPFSCYICKKTFVQIHTLERHLVKHSVEKSYTCDVCGKSFKYKCDIRSHVRTHFEEPYSCEICSKPFSRKQSLKRHLATHSDKKPISCEYCPKTFAHRDYLQAHRTIHTGQKPYSCVICGKTFRLKRNLDVHLKKKNHFKIIKNHRKKTRFRKKKTASNSFHPFDSYNAIIGQTHGQSQTNDTPFASEVENSTENNFI